MCYYGVVIEYDEKEEPIKGMHALKVEFVECSFVTFVTKNLFKLYSIFLCIISIYFYSTFLGFRITKTIKILNCYKGFYNYDEISNELNTRLLFEK